MSRAAEGRDRHPRLARDRRRNRTGVRCGSSTFGDAVTDPAWQKKPTWYQVSTNDRMINPDSEPRMAERMNPRNTIELDASHASLASQPSAIVDLIDEAATTLS